MPIYIYLQNEVMPTALCRAKVHHQLTCPKIDFFDNVESITTPSTNEKLQLQESYKINLGKKSLFRLTSMKNKD